MRRLAAALGLILGVSSCSRCGGDAGGVGATTASSSASSASTASTASTAAPEAPPDADLPEVKDSGPGRATAALRAILTHHGVPFDAAALERDCEVDEEGASIDDLEDAADKLGLDVRQVLVPREHVLLPEAKLLPGIVIVEGLEGPDSADFVLLFRIDGERALIMDPLQGRRWVPRAELARSVFADEVTIPAEDWHGAEADPRFQDALRARAVALGVPADDARRLVDAAASDPASRALGALDAAARKLEADPAAARGDVAAGLARAVACAKERCEGGDPTPAAFYAAHPAPKGEGGQAQVTVRAALMLVVAGKRTPGP